MVRKNTAGIDRVPIEFSCCPLCFHDMKLHGGPLGCACASVERFVHFGGPLGANPRTGGVKCVKVCGCGRESGRVKAA